VAQQGAVALWRMDFPEAAIQWGKQASVELQWMLPPTLPERSLWHRAHFEMLSDFGVWCSSDDIAIFSTACRPVLEQEGLLAVLRSASVQTSSKSDIRKAVPTDTFFKLVSESVKAAGDNYFRDFFFDSNKVLCYQRAEDSKPRLCVSAVCKQAVLRAVHGGSVLARHPGVGRTSAAVAHSYYWPRFFADVAHFVRSCKTCAAAKSSNQKRVGAESYSAVPIQPFTSWAMDLIGPLPTTKLGHEWIMTWVDRTSKTIVAAPAHSDRTSAEDIAALTFKEISCRFGLPLTLTMDNDVRFVGAVWRALWKLCGTKLKFTSSYNPQSDPAERANRQVLEGVRAAVATVVQYDEWDLTLPHITFGLNSHISAATGVSPFEFAHGFSPRVPLTMGLDTAVLEE